MKKEELVYVIADYTHDEEHKNIVVNALDDYLNTEWKNNFKSNNKLITQKDYLNEMLNWHQECYDNKVFKIPLDHEQSEYLNWLAARLARVNNEKKELPILNKERLLIWLKGLKESQNSESLIDWYENLMADVERLWQ